MVKTLIKVAATTALVLPLTFASQAPAAVAQTGDEVHTWGRNQFGQLGNGTTSPSTVPGSEVPTPASVPAGTAVTAVSGGYGHSVALTSTGRVLAWGDNQVGQLGDGTFIDSAAPVEVNLPAGTTVTAIDSGDDHVLALASTGTVLAWGYNEWGQLGNGITGVDSNVPVDVNLSAGAPVTAISAGAGHGLALTSTGQVWAWGDNDFGQLGDGTTTNRDEPVPVNLPAGTSITAISAGDDHSLALTSTGTVLAWGYNGGGQLGDGTTTTRTSPVPVLLPADATVTQLASGSGFQSYALTATGTALAWGDNTYGQIGDGTTTRRTTPVPVLLPAGTTVTQLDSGDDHTVALTSTGTVLAWGYNRYGQVGDGTTTNRTAPVPVDFDLPAGAAVTAVGVGSYHSLAVAQSPQSTTTLTVQPEQAEVGDTITFTATVTCTAGIPTGTVTFDDETGTQIGTASLDGSGTATLDHSSLAVGQHAITAHYSGDSRCPGSSSEPVTLTITPGDTPPPTPPTTEAPPSPDTPAPPTTEAPPSPDTPAPPTNEAPPPSLDSLPVSDTPSDAPPPGEMATTGFPSPTFTIAGLLLVVTGTALLLGRRLSARRRLTTSE